jgi:HSP20 family protein
MKGGQRSGVSARGPAVRYRRARYRHVVVAAVGPIGGAWLAVRPALTFSAPVWRPAADVCEAAGALVVTVDLAGVDPDSVDLVLFDDALIVGGTRRISSHLPDEVYHAAEIRQGPFRLDIALPGSIDPDRADARYERGILRITLPRPGADGDGRRA